MQMWGSLDPASMFRARQAAKQAQPRAMPPGYDPNVHQPSIGFVPGFEQASGPSATPLAPQMSPYDSYMSRFRTGAQIGPPGPGSSQEQNQAYLDAQRDFRSQSRSRFAADQPRSLAENMALTPDLSGARSPVMSIDEFSRSGLMGPTTMEFRNPVEFEGKMVDPVLVRRYEAYRSGLTQPMQLPVQQNQYRPPMQPSSDPFGPMVQPFQQQHMQAASNQVPSQQSPFGSMLPQNAMMQRFSPAMFGGLGAFGGGYPSPMMFGGGYPSPMMFGGGYPSPMMFGGYGQGIGSFFQPAAPYGLPAFNSQVSQRQYAPQASGQPQTQYAPQASGQPQTQYAPQPSF